MPRRKADGEETANGEAKAAEKLTLKANSNSASEQEKNAIVGKEKTLQQQIKEARGEGEGGEKEKEMLEYEDGADKEAEKLLEEAFPERKAIDIRLESRRKFNEKFGIDPNAPGTGLIVKISDKFKTPRCTRAG